MLSTQSEEEKANKCTHSTAPKEVVFHCARIPPREKGKLAKERACAGAFALWGKLLGAGLHFDGELPSESSCMGTLAMTSASLLRVKRKERWSVKKDTH